MDQLKFRGENPGAVQFGNFINYYQFNPVENRLKLLPIDIWDPNKLFFGLDIGCNAGVKKYIITFDIILFHLIFVGLDNRIIQYIK